MSFSFKYKKNDVEVSEQEASWNHLDYVVKFVSGKAVKAKSLEEALEAIKSHVEQ